MATRTLAERVAILAPLGILPLLSQEQIEAYYGVSPWTVNKWVRRGCPVEDTPVAHGRRFDLERVKAWGRECGENAAA